MIVAQWERIDLFEKVKHKRKLPKSFADVILRANELQSPDEISARYGLPIAFAKWYSSFAPFFLKLRKMRDDLTHGGSGAAEALFCTERGYGIQRHEGVWGEVYNWPADVELPNHLVPIRPPLCAIIGNVIAATDSFAEVLSQTIQMPGELFPGLYYFS